MKTAALLMLVLAAACDDELATIEPAPAAPAPFTQPAGRHRCAEAVSTLRAQVREAQQAVRAEMQAACGTDERPTCMEWRHASLALTRKLNDLHQRGSTALIPAGVVYRDAELPQDAPDGLEARVHSAGEAALAATQQGAPCFEFAAGL